MTDPHQLAQFVLHDPYPERVFTEQAALAASGVRHATDRLHASWARHMYANYQHYRTAE